jgi:predicted nucleic-acid-binding Zn-ribbon protein
MSRSSKQATPGRYSLMSKPIRCPHCQGSEFMPGEAQLNTAMASLINLDWMNKSAVILSCTACGQIQWFGQQPSRDS